MAEAKHLTTDELEAGLDEVRRAPKDGGVVRLIVRRPRDGEREVLQEGELHLVHGLVGDCWGAAGEPGDEPPDPEAQVTVMNARAAALVAHSPERWQLAGDQLYVDLDIGRENLPPGSRLAIGEAVLEVSEKPHTGCKLFVSRFGLDAMKFVNSPTGRDLCLRGINTRVVQPGMVRVGDVARKVGS